MAAGKHLPVPVEVSTETAAVIRRSQIVILCGIHPDLIDRLTNLGLIEPVGRDVHDDEPLFQREAIPLLEKILRLRR